MSTAALLLQAEEEAASARTLSSRSGIIEAQTDKVDGPQREENYRNVPVRHRRYLHQRPAASIVPGGMRDVATTAPAATAGPSSQSDDQGSHPSRRNVKGGSRRDKTSEDRPSRQTSSQSSGEGAPRRSERLRAKAESPADKPEKASGANKNREKTSSGEPSTAQPIDAKAKIPARNNAKPTNAAVIGQKRGRDAPNGVSDLAKTENSSRKKARVTKTTGVDPISGGLTIAGPSTKATKENTSRRRKKSAA
ncbi:uncharacterized protein B0H18DRAFT_950695 [Fomitopsis serialis]|uniref:uncharacterized protein n=1 Tax=Fomitopsis serialis TaxID=139415 RepID=UPI002007B422|nr:uncharacterized protein B0H18DRAFT_950695 [Neoantrodia serialis]KAH9936396.1 hypothetical protein B0H18DRAFT_950695 [Neoantrodia serialis]